MQGAAAQQQGVDRRAVAKGIIWTVPAISLAAAAPAYAASPTGCHTLNWASTSGTATSISGTATRDSGSSGPSVSVSVTTSRSGGSAVTFGAERYDMKGYAAGSQAAVGSNNTRNNQSNSFVVAPGSTSSVLVLNQWSGATGQPTRANQTLTFSISSSGTTRLPRSISFKIYDVTSQVSGENSKFYYSDRVAITGGTVAFSQFTGYSQSSYTTASNGVLDMKDKTQVSTQTGNHVTATITNPTSNRFTLNYSNSATQAPTITGNQQYIALGDLRVCY
ncbi:hypothetical protein [Kocuria palustris]|uniref:hypothetical protein n=1 Tax=Kocuria palustris TaxID=71999 RepID=UPI0011A2D1C2|nr:hypothetical protein [Kocuria palustris]